MELDNLIDTKSKVQEFREIEEKSNDVCSVILKVENSDFPSNMTLDTMTLFGKTMTEWVANAVFDTDIRYASVGFRDDFLPAVKNAYNPNSKWTFVLFNDAPLFERKTYLQILEYCELKSINVLRLTRGYVFSTAYLTKIESLLNPQIEYFEEEDFITCHSLKQFAMVADIMKNRILSYFMKNGVVILDPQSTFIDCDVKIGSGTIIEPFNKILGKTIIESNVQIKSNNTIHNCIICENSVVCGCKISESFVGKNVQVNANTVIEKSKICDDVIVPEFCKIDSVVVDRECELKSFFEYKGE